MARKRRAEQPLVRRPALADPKNRKEPQAVAVKGNTKTALRNVAASRTRPHHPRFTLSDAAAWALATLVVGTVLIAACVVLTLGWPS